MRSPPPGGARRCLARRASGAATRSAACRTAVTFLGTTADASPPTWVGPHGPAGQAAPDPYTRRLHRPTVTRLCCTGENRPTCVGARRCLARRASGAAHPRGAPRCGALGHMAALALPPQWPALRAGGSGTAGAELPVSGPHGAASTGEATPCAAPDSRDPAPSPTAWNRSGLRRFGPGASWPRSSHRA